MVKCPLVSGGIKCGSRHSGQPNGRIGTVRVGLLHLNSFTTATAQNSSMTVKHSLLGAV